MTAHRPHPITGPWPFAVHTERLASRYGCRIDLVDRVPEPDSLIYDDPDALLYDNCPRCDEQAENPLFLDADKLRAAWDRMFHVERHDGYYRTVNERKLCVRLYLMALTIARLQGHGDPWKVVPDAGS